MIALLLMVVVALAQAPVEVRVESEDGRPVPGITVSAGVASAEVLAMGVTDAEGRVRFEGLPPGELEIEAAGSDPARVAFPFTAEHRVRVELHVEAPFVLTSDVLERMPVQNPVVILATPQLLEPAPPPCHWAMGVAASATPSGRGWDLGTAGPVATSASPVLSRQCAVRRLWASVDLVPWLRHTYGGGQRGALWVVGHAGLRVARLGDTSFVPYLASQGAAFGGGLRIASALGPLVVETRLAILAGANPDVQTWVLVRPNRWGGKLRPFTTAGLSLGSLVGLDRRVHKWFGVRAGLLTSPVSDTVLQPTALVDGVVRWRRWSLAPSVGASWRDRALKPVAGARLQWHRAVTAHAGLLLGPGTGGVVVPDVGVTVGW